MIGVVFIQLALKGEHHIIRIEVARRFEIFGGLPLHTFAQVEGVSFTVFTDIPLLCQRSVQFGGADSELNQSVVDLT